MGALIYSLKIYTTSFFSIIYYEADPGLYVIQKAKASNGFWWQSTKHFMRKEAFRMFVLHSLRCYWPEIDAIIHTLLLNGNHMPLPQFSFEASTVTEPSPVTKTLCFPHLLQLTASEERQGWEKCTTEQPGHMVQ